MTNDKDTPPDPPDKSDEKKEDFDFKPLHPDEPADSQAEQKVPPAAGEERPIPPWAEKIRDWITRNKTFALFIGFLVIAAGMWLISLSREDAGDKEIDSTQSVTALDEIPVNVMEVRLGRFQDPIEAVGTLKGEAEVDLRFEVEGKIQKFMVEEGDRVRKNQLIASLNDRDTRLKVDRAKNKLEKSEKLFNLGGISRTELEEARLDLEVAQADLDKTRLRAVRDGIIGDKAADIGEYVTPQRKIATLVSIKNVQVKVGIIEKQVDKVYPGQKILVTIDAYPGNIFEGKIDSISPIIKGDAKTFEITAEIPNPDSLLLPGMFARTRIITYEADDALSVPNDALEKSPSGFKVYVVNKDNVAEARDIEVGYVASEFTQIKSGLSPGDIVVVQRPPELKSGSKVKIIDVANQ